MAYLLITSVLWSFSFGLIKSELAGLNPYSVAFIRLALSCLVFLPFLRPVPLKRAVALMAIGLVQFGIMYSLYIYSYQFLKAYQVAVLTITTPVFAVFIHSLLARRWRARYWAAALLVVGAALILVVEKDSWSLSLQGILLIQGANLCFAAGQMLYKHIIPEHAEPSRHFAILYAGGLLAPLFPMLLGGFQLPEQSSQWWALLYLGLIPSGLGFFLWNKGVLSVNGGTAAAMNNLKIPMAAFLSWAVFAEAIHMGGLLFSTLLFAGALYLTQFHKPFVSQTIAPTKGQKPSSDN